MDRFRLLAQTIVLFVTAFTLRTVALALPQLPVDINLQRGWYGGLAVETGQRECNERRLGCEIGCELNAAEAQGTTKGARCRDDITNAKTAEIVRIIMREGQVQDIKAVVLQVEAGRRIS